MINVTEWMKILVVLKISINNTLIYKRLCVFITISNSGFDGNTNYRLVTIVHTLKLPQKRQFSPNYTKLTTLSMRTYVGKSKIESTKKVSGSIPTGGNFFCWIFFLFALLQVSLYWHTLKSTHRNFLYDYASLENIFSFASNLFKVTTVKWVLFNKCVKAKAMIYIYSHVWVHFRLKHPAGSSVNSVFFEKIRNSDLVL